MLDFVILLGLKIKYNANVYMPREFLNYLTPFFDNLEIKAAEDHLSLIHI